jgi:hypothetical protein
MNIYLMENNLLQTACVLTFLTVPVFSGFAREEVLLSLSLHG